MKYFTGSYARSTTVRAVKDVDLLADVAHRLTTKLDKYYDKTTGTFVDGAPDAPRPRPDTFKIAVRAIKGHSFGPVAVQGSRSIAVRFPENLGPIDILPAFDATAGGHIICYEDLESALHPTLPGKAPHPEQLRRARDLERRARILLRRMLRVVRVRRVRTNTVATLDGVDHSVECHRSRAPGRKTWSSPAFRTPAAA